MVVAEIKRLQHPNKAGLAYHCGDLNALKGFQPGLPHINIRNRIANINININSNININIHIKVRNWITNININRIANINIAYLQSDYQCIKMYQHLQLYSYWKTFYFLHPRCP